MRAALVLASVAVSVVALGVPAGAGAGPPDRRSYPGAQPARVSTGSPSRSSVVISAGDEPAKGIVPPKNPPKNLPPIPNFFSSCAGGVLDDSTACNSKALQAIDQARGTEPLGKLSFSLARFLKLSVVDQLFTIADLERVSRGEAPMVALTSQLDAVAKIGANGNVDPDFTGQKLSGGAQVYAWGANWAGGTESALGSDDSWMYDDGPGGFNEDCTKTNASGCWGHRDNILGLWANDLAARDCPASERQLMMGAAHATPASGFGPSFTQIFVAACGVRPPDEVYTWARAQVAIGVRPRAPTEVGIASSADGKGYFEVSSAGEVSAFGDARRAGGLSAKALPAPIVAIATSNVKGGYWLVGSNGAVYPFGHAPSYGDLRSQHLAQPVVGIAVDHATGGYWLVAANGAVFSFHARYHGGATRRKLPQPIVAIVADPAAAGYWLIGADGSVYPFGSAKNRGSEEGRHLAAPIVAAAATRDGLGYWLAAGNGAVYRFGDAVYKGDEAGRHLPAPVTAMAATPASTGYWLLGASGVVYRFDAP